MSDTSSVNPNPSNNNRVGSNAPSEPPKESGKGWDSSSGMNWLGMHFNQKETKQLWSIISQNIGNQIKKDQDRAVKALKKLNPENSQDDNS